MKCDEITITVTLLFAIEQIIKKFVELMNATFQALKKVNFKASATLY